MKRFLLIIFFSIISSCGANNSFISPIDPNIEPISFDVVQKNFEVNADLPDYTLKLITYWFDEKVKVDGFDGEMTFTISEYFEEISSIDEGKRVDISLSFSAVLNKPSLSQTSLIEGSVSSYGTLTGNFSLSEFDTVIQNTQSDLILRLSRDLKSKI